MAGGEELKKSVRIVERLYDKRYKLLFVIPVLMLLFSFVYLISFNAKNGDFIRKDVTLTGGTSITVFTEKEIIPGEIKDVLASEFGEVVVRALTDMRTGKQKAFVVEIMASDESLDDNDLENADKLKKEIQKYLGYALTEENSSMEFTGAALGKSFYRELIRALIIAFTLMAVVVFVIFKVPVPSIAVILAALTDLIVTLAIVNLIGIRVSTAGIAAFLMLIGYSVDTDIMLTTRLIKRRGQKIIQRMENAMKTGLTMTITSIIAVFVAYLIALSPVLKQVFIILTIGLSVDLIATWCGTAPLLKWYCDKKHII